MSAGHRKAVPQGAAWFITGTDTGVGKSLVSAALMVHLRARYARVAGMKPVAAGSMRAPNGEWTNEDVLALQAVATVDLPQALVNPYLLHAPVSPHIAAARDGVALELDTITRACTSLRGQTDALVVEGAGGFRVPLSDALDGSDMAVALGLPVVLVVGLRLGCLNHAVLTAESIAARGLRLVGWVANHIDPGMPEQAANIAWLQSQLKVSCLADLPHGAAPDAEQMAAYFHLPEEFFV